MKARLAWLAFVVAVVFATVSLFLPPQGKIDASVVLYRYRLKHDSVFVHRTDTAFVEHRVVKRVEVPRRRTWFDYTSYAALAILVVLLVRKVRSHYSTTY
jgi:hypothetical protein